MIKEDEALVMKAIALCFKPYLKIEEALIYCDLCRTQFTKRCEEMGIFKTPGGYFKKEDLDLICAGGSSKYTGNAEILRRATVHRKFG
ncbi:MAG: hypothetical protein M9933_09585 [Chitinophagaceae bacterium]|jgi:hypothetical protein|nr:hypothetical protein [Chitinophagaceae bacterium]HRQ48978.1 hypothetical protein [Agriterribacter sp.]